jgi:hypothetical protein
MVDNAGDTVAHLAAIKQVLPEDFPDWNLLDRDGATVAHRAARNGTLPKGFSKWSLAMPDGETVAHTFVSAAGLGLSYRDSGDRAMLPEHFSGWFWATSDGVTVIERAREVGCSEIIALYEQQMLSNRIKKGDKVSSKASINKGGV